MTTVRPGVALQFEAGTRRQSRGRTVVKWVTTTDHKVIGNLYFISSFAFFLLAGLLAMLIRAELFAPGLQVVDNPEQYNALFTMHGTIMLLLFATPLFAGFANALMPIQIGAPDVAFPRLNMLAYWMYVFGGLIAASGFLTPTGAASFGWFAYTPLSDVTYSPGLGGDLWVFGLALGGFGTILGAVNFITTIICLRAPGMTMFRMPMFTWTILITSILVLMAFPVLASALLALGADRRFGAHIFDPANNGPMLWQHLFWFFGHPEVYIIALPFFGIISEILPVFSRKPLFGYKSMIFAVIAIAALSVSVWAHHMYGTGQVLLPFFAIMTMLIAVPTGVKFFNWIGTMWHGSLSFETPMLWALGFMVTFLFGGLTGIILSSPPLDFHLTDSYFVVAHFHYVVFGTVVFAMFAGFYFWWPKFTGRMLNERLGKIHFWMLFIGFHTTFLIQHLLGIRGMPRRYADYLPEDNFTWMNQISSGGAFLLGASTIPFLYNVWKTYRTAPLVVTDDPWGYGGSLEWATSCPPPRHNFVSIPRIRSERPAFDLHHPEVAEFEGPVADKNVLDTLLGAPDIRHEGRGRHRQGGGTREGSTEGSTDQDRDEKGGDLR
jgi:cytochrome c oxidase subunit 1